MPTQNTPHRLPHVNEAAKKLYEQAQQIAKIRGHKHLTELQLTKLAEAAQIEGLSVLEVLDVALDAPHERMAQNVKHARRHVSNLFGKLADALNPE
jgi:hypothetical protein